MIILIVRVILKIEVIKGHPFWSTAIRLTEPEHALQHEGHPWLTIQLYQDWIAE